MTYKKLTTRLTRITMIKTRISLNAFLSIYILLFFMIISAKTFSPLHADVVIIDDGAIYLGKVKSVDSQVMVFESFGKDINLSTAKVLKNHKSLDDISAKKISILLKDGSTISGKIDNFDDEIGIFLNIGFGNITIPVGAVNEIRDPEIRKSYFGNDYKFGASAGWYYMTGSLAESYGSTFTANLYAEKMTPVRGLAGGIDISYNLMNFTKDDKMNYQMFALKPYLMYVFLDFKKTVSFLDKINPFVALYAGVAYVSLEDKRDYAKASNLSEIDPDFMAAAGIDYPLTGNLSIRASGGYRLVLQSNVIFQNITASLGANYGY